MLRHASCVNVTFMNSLMVREALGNNTHMNERYTFDTCVKRRSMGVKRFIPFQQLVRPWHSSIPTASLLNLAVSYLTDSANSLHYSLRFHSVGFSYSLPWHHQAINSLLCFANA